MHARAEVVRARASGFCHYASHTNSVDHTAHCVQCRDLAALLPKLKSPGYVKLIGAEIEKPALTIAEVSMTKAERKKKAKRAYNASRATSNRVARLLSGQFVRTRSTKQLVPVVPSPPNTN